MYLAKGSSDYENGVIIDNLLYQVVLKPKHAEHFMDNFLSNNDHDVRPRDVLRILKRSIIRKLKSSGNRFLAIGKHNNVVYNTFFDLGINHIYLVTCYRCHSWDLLKEYEKYRDKYNLR